ncbi:MAG: universal stress protein [Saprospiraceae bacterium]|nr:universal stress protein [Saprospiraceae bacterium]
MFSVFKNMFGGGDDKVIENNAVIIDVRSKNEFASGHLASAVNIPLEQIESHAETLKSHPQVVLYCRSGNRSEHAKKILTTCGLSNVLDAGSLGNAQALLASTGIHSDLIIKENIPEMSHSGDVLKDENVLKVLIPTDFSVQADFSYLMTRKLEEHLSVDIHFLHVMDVPDTVTVDDLGEVQTCGEIDINFIKDQKKIAENKLQQLRAQYGEHISIHLILGKVTDSILNFAESNHYDLIVMGTKGAWGLKEKLSSSQAQMIARRSQIPVMSLMCDRSDLIIKDVLFVHDFKEGDNTSVPLMHKFSRYFDAVYHQLYIYSDVMSLRQDDMIIAMDKYASEHGIGQHKNHFIKADNVEEGVNAFIKTQDVDLVFVGTHGKGGIFHKSAAESLIKHLFKPIISFHLHQN